MYDELVKQLRDAAKMSEALGVLLPHSEGNATADLYRRAADAIEELSKILDAVNDAHNEGYDVGYWAGRRDYEPKWIPVTERLPENVRDVQITVFWHDAWRTMYGYYDGSFWHLYAPMHTEVADVEVIGWMEKPAPMPTPPKEEN